MAEPSDRVFFSDLPAEVDETAVRTIFGAYGNIKFCKHLEGKCAAIVQFASNEEAKWIVDNLNGNIAQGLSTPVSCKYANPIGGGKGGGAGGWGGNGGGWSGNGGNGAWGGNGKGAGGGARWEPYSANPAKGDSKGGKGKGGCSISILIKGLQQSGVLPGGRWSNDENALYINGLPSDTTNGDLYDIFAPFGAMPSKGAYAQTRQDGSCSGIGFVNFLTAEAAQNAIATLNGTQMPDGSALRVQPKGPSKKTQGGGKGGKW